MVTWLPLTAYIAPCGLVFVAPHHQLLSLSIRKAILVWVFVCMQCTVFPFVVMVVAVFGVFALSIVSKNVYIVPVVAHGLAPRVSLR